MEKYKSMIRFFIILNALLVSTSLACDIAVVSPRASSTGRPFIWKVRDNGLAWEQEVASYKRDDNRVNPAAGGSVRVIDRTRGTAAQSGGVNEAGFAITNTTVYQESPIHEYLSSANLNVMSVALKECVTVEDFHNYIKTWHLRDSNWTRILSGNFVVIDASGGAALYELTTGNSQTDMYAYGGRVKMHRIDANTGFVTNEDDMLIGNNGQIGQITDYASGNVVQVMDMNRDLLTTDYTLSADRQTIFDRNGTIIDSGNNFIGFVNRTNSSFWVSLNDDTPREDRATDMLTELAEEGNLNYKTVLQEVTRDTDIDAYYLDTYDNLSNLDPGTDTQQSTFHTISRYSTNVAFVVDGVIPGDDPRLSTMWINLGEPSAGAASPYFPAANNIPEESWADFKLFRSIPLDLSPTCFLNQAMADRRNTLYDSSSGSSLALPPIDITSQLFLDLLFVDWLAPREETWSQFEGELSEWHVLYLQYLAENDETDKTVDYPGLMEVQTWAIPLETVIIEKTEGYLAALKADPSRITESNLSDFSDYCATFLLDNYSNQSDNAVQWNYENPWESTPTPTKFLRFPRWW